MDSLYTWQLFSICTPEKSSVGRSMGKGTEYACHDYQNHLKKCGIKPSMNRQGKMTDNIYVETFFRTFKTEAYHGERFKDESHLRKTTQWYLEEYYNNQRIHSSLNFKTPQQYESM
ncbi:MULTISPECIES: integrase core domain-containing protein [unclassified Alteromonas]|uniref:integrase core domain-containing protein n=1 Tax=unclassified Alteromonas TaxID=2614992 RepID=UPI0009DF4F01|nr:MULTISPECIES: integrase core domain-containing protein [unclassified Alteromonas]